MVKHWQQVEQEALARMATYHRERARAHSNQQFVTRHFKAALRAAQHFILARTYTRLSEK